MIETLKPTKIFDEPSNFEIQKSRFPLGFPLRFPLGFPLEFPLGIPLGFSLGFL